MSDPLPDRPAPPRQAYLVVRFSRGRCGARTTVAEACFDGADGQGVDALADIVGSDVSGDEDVSVAAPRRRARGGVSRASGAPRGGQRRRQGRGDQRGREAPAFDEADDDDGA
ncbi:MULTISPECIES: hypothetical protein [unclassified Rhizobacter]|uniref:hypothetical protein n=1 Tax=unclassified Rhizobacter TaxID=2640088 RepID=UPI0012F71B81|nr:MULTISPECIES: hypothetical protein [unclassified Rhizobacter]